MKKILTLLLLLAMLLSLCACADKEQAAVSQEAIEPSAAVETPAQPDYDALAAEAAELYYAGDYEAAFKALSELEDSGLAQVNELLGLCYYYGYGTEAEPDTGLALLEKSGSLLSKYIMAEAAMTGDGAVQDPQRAGELYAAFVAGAEGAELSGSEYAALSHCYAMARGAELDLDEAMYCAAKAVEAGGLSLFEKAGLADFILEQAGNTLESIQAELNEQGYTLADLADESKTFYLQNADDFKARVSSVEAEQEKAHQLFDEAKDGLRALAEQDNLRAIKLMGDYYFGALGKTPQDYVKAMEYYMQAADFDYAPAQAQIALMYQDGLGVDVSYEQAMEWNNRAAQQGNAQGQAQIGYMYHMGLGVTQNLNEAGRWYSRAADQGDLWASAKLAETELTNPQLAFEFHA